jgi:hypothetical protein
VGDAVAENGIVQYFGDVFLRVNLAEGLRAVFSGKYDIAHLCSVVILFQPGLSGKHFLLDKFSRFIYGDSTRPLPGQSF